MAHIEAKQVMKISSSHINLCPGMKKKLIVKGCKSRIKWYSSNKAIATVSKKGIVKGKKQGKTVIYAINLQGKKVKCRVNVGKYVSSIKLSSASNVVLYAGQKARIRCSVKPNKVYNKALCYSSLNRKIATVNTKGVLWGIKEGIVKIKISSKGITCKKKKAKIYVLVCVKEKDKGKSIDIQQPDEDTVVDDPDKKEETLAQKIANIPTPSQDQMVAARMVVSYTEGGEEFTNTLYFLNKNYAGTIQLSFNGKLMKSNESIADLLSGLEDTIRYSGWNSSRTIHLYKDKATESVPEPAWEIRDVTVDPPIVVYLNGYLNDKKYGTPYGLVITQGDTSSLVSFSATGKKV